MKIVLNKQYGVFSLPEKFKTLYNITSIEEEWAVERTDERLVHFVEYEGGATEWGVLKVIEIPDDCTDWELNDYDGYESIIYVVDGKIYHA